jgi:hypothetical protein
MKTKLDPQMIAIVSLVVAGLLIGAVGYFLVISPQRSKSASLKTDIANAQTELVVAQGASAKPVPFRASDLFRLANAMPSRTDMPGILLSLRHLAQNSKVQLTSVHPSPAVAQALGYSAVPLGITITGTYPQITKFVGLVRRDVRFAGGVRLETSGRFFDTDSINLQPTVSTASVAQAAAVAAANGQTPTTPTPAKGKAKAVATSLSAQLMLVAFTYTGVVIAPTPPAGATTTGSTTTTSTTTTTAGA